MDIHTFSARLFYRHTDTGEELYPWYAVWLVTTASFMNLKANKFIYLFTIVLSFALELRNLPYMLMGYYEGPGPMLRTTFTIVPIALFFVWYLWKKKLHTKIILVALVIVAFLLRWYLMPGHLFFGPEQGTDMLVVRDIVVNHKLTLIGAKTDIQGIFHGPIYYYLASIPFALSRGNPVAIVAFFIVIQALSIFLAYQLAFELTKKKRNRIHCSCGICSKLPVYCLFPMAFKSTALHPSFPAIRVIVSRFARGKHWYLVAVACAYGLLGQTEFINFLVFAAISIILLVIFWKQLLKTRPVEIVLSLLVGGVTSAATYVLFDLRHNFLMSRAVLALLAGKSGYQLPFVTSVVSAFRVFAEQMARTAGFDGWLAGTVVLLLAATGLCMQWKRHTSLTLLAVWLVIPPILFSILRHAMLDQLYAGVIGGFIILLAICIDWVWEKKMILGAALLFVCIAANVHAISGNLPDNYNVFFQPQQPAVRYSDQLKVVDWIYASAHGRPFEFQAYTIPYFWQTAWIYLFDEYGMQKYRYGPTAVNRKLLYVIIQKDRLSPPFQRDWYTKTVSTWGPLIKYTTFGEYTVEEREQESR